MTSGVQTWRAALVTPEGTLRGRFWWGVLVCGGGADLAGISCWRLRWCARGSWARRIWRAGDDPKYRGNARVLAGLGLGITATKYVSELRRLDPLRARQSVPPGWESHGTIVE